MADRVDDLTPAETPAESELTERGRRTRRALVRAARKVFEAKGFLDTRVSDIADEAEVAYGTFYTYFDSKEQVFSEVITGLVDDMRAIARAEPVTGTDPSSRIERANRGYLRSYQRNAELMAILEQVATFNPELREVRRRARRFWVERSASAIAGWQQQGLVSSSIDPYYAATALGSMVDRSAYVWLVLGEPYDEDTAVEQLSGLYCRALGLPWPPPGRHEQVAPASPPRRAQRGSRARKS